MKTLSNTEADLKKTLLIKKRVFNARHRVKIAAVSAPSCIWKLWLYMKYSIMPYIRWTNIFTRFLNEQSQSIMFFKIVVFKSFSIFTERHLYFSLFKKKDLKSYSDLSVFQWILQYFSKHFFYRALSVGASENKKHIAIFSNKLERGVLRCKIWKVVTNEHIMYCPEISLSDGKNWQVCISKASGHTFPLERI